MISETNRRIYGDLLLLEGLPIRALPQNRMEDVNKVEDPNQFAVCIERPEGASPAFSA